MKMRMKKSTKWVWVSFLIILLVEGWFCEGCWKQERDALLHLQAQFNEPVGYDISDCCLWDYVECNNTTRRVARLTLSGRWYKWVGNWYLNISDFQAFEALESLDLSFNSILGCVQNKGAGSAENLSFSFSNLKHLDLGHNFLNNSGILSCLSSMERNVLAGRSIHTSKGTLSWPSNLEVLDLSYNSFGNDIISSFRELKYLKQLDLSGNQLEGSVDINELYGLTKLEILDLSYNNISSVVARQGIKMSLSNVSALHLDGCKIDGNMLRKSLRPFPYIKNIYLNQNQFKGTILARDFGELNNLEHLELSFSSNITNEFFESIGSLTSLKVLSMRSCGINGTLPIGGWSMIKKLEQLDLSYNEFEGELPLSFSNMTSLKNLDISHNSFTGNPAFTLASLSSLESLDFRNNQLDIPSSFTFLAKYTNLKFIYGGENKVILDLYPTFQSWVPKFQLQEFQLSSTTEDSFLPLPNFLVHQYNLSRVDLSNIKFGGELPKWLMENNTRLASLILRNCSFTGLFQLPLRRMPDLYLFDISNNAVYGQFPWSNISSIFPMLEHLYVSRNAFDGSLPHEFGQMMGSLLTLDLSSNNFSGEIPLPRNISVGEFSLVTLRLSDNKLHGPVCTTLATLQISQELYLDGNNFSGSVEGCFNISFLEILDISNNNFVGKLGNFSYQMDSLLMANNNLEGSIPIELFKHSSLHYLDLSENNLSGSLPSFTSSLIYVHLSNNKLSGLTTTMFNESSSLVLLDLSNNDITGHLQDIMGNTTKLSVLTLKGNYFMGQIPNHLCKLRALAILDLSYNQLFGPIPKCMGEIPFASSIMTLIRYPLLTKIYYNKEHQQVNFTTKKRFETYKGNILLYMSGMDLSHNELNGNIPLELGNMTDIRAINLSHNHLIGRIPATFCHLKQIESLDLSFNKLMGEIPPQLTELTSLEVFNLAHNNLSGRTPDRKNQFITFDESSYEGNPFLCGLPLNKSCFNADKQPYGILPNNASDDGFMDKQFFYVSFAVSYTSILLVIIIVLYINPYWRRAWFNFIEFVISTCYYFVVDNFHSRFTYGNM